ncbi:hypothetical protein CHK_0511 [Christensenella hongkongensis]|uniref:Uncharacterized protein n=1 Tax=Christensenella hongkongensis TaxID=270498 RepID=A0A0M2NHJ2_9FIRM|nr:hypothetical protein CHK_0511 [Christensenella hongkongensis]
MQIMAELCLQPIQSRLKKFFIFYKIIKQVIIISEETI